MDVLKIVVGRYEGQIGFFSIDWEKWSEMSGKVADNSQIKDLLKVKNNKREQNESSAFIDGLAYMEEKDQKKSLVSFLVKKVSEIMWLEADRIDINKNLYDQGMDSVMLVELKGVIIKATGYSLKPSDMVHNPTILFISEILHKELVTK